MLPLLWAGWAGAFLVRLACLLLGAPALLGRRVEVATPVNSLIRLSEGFWLKHFGLSPYAGSAYHGSPVLLELLGPFATNSTFCSLLCVFADFSAAVMLAAIGRHLQSSQSMQFYKLGVVKLMRIKGLTKFDIGTTAAIFYLWNPFTIVTCLGGCTTSLENSMVILALYGSVIGNIPLSAFGWAFSTHTSLYPVVLLIPIALNVAVGVDHPPKKLFKTGSVPEVTECKGSVEVESHEQTTTMSSSMDRDICGLYTFRVHHLQDLIIWCFLWWAYILILCMLSLGGAEGLKAMFSETYGFILRVEELSPNLGLFWYFFTEVFDFFRPFFLLVFHANVLFMILPLTIRLNHRPMFLAFVFLAVCAMLKSYPSVGDAALYLGLLPLFVNELSGMRFTFFLLNSSIGVAFLSPVMYNLWIWRGTGNANFYFAMSLVYACIQLILIVETVSTVLIFDRNLRKIKDTQISGGCTS